jgi:predicted TIM-barrel fold metal-dependent hydrolase
MPEETAMSQFRVISADSHVREPGDLWLNYIDPAFRERAPRLVSAEDGDYWVCDGRPPFPVRANNPPGAPPTRKSAVGRYADNLPGGWDPQARVADMARDGVDAEVIYPTVSMDFYQLADLPYAYACFRAYNRWLADYCRTHPDRLKGIGATSVDDLDAALYDLRQIRELGLVGVGIGIRVAEDRDYDDPRYDRFWATAQDLGLPVSFHTLTGKGNQLTRPGVDYAGMPHWIQRTLGLLIFGGVFERFPGLKVISVESDIGWIPTWLERADHTTRRSVAYRENPSKLLPGDYFREHVRATFIRDRVGIRLRDLIGVNTIMWSSDYPHVDSTWPESQASIERELFDVPEAEKRRIICQNAAELYGFA